MGNNPTAGLRKCLHWSSLETAAWNLSGLREEGEDSERKGSMKVFLQRHEVRTQGDMKKEGMPQNGCPDLKKKKTNTVQLHRLSKDRARCLLACESWANFSPEQGLLCSCGWSLKNHGWGGVRVPSGGSHGEQADCTLPSTPPHLGHSIAPQSWLTGRRH